MRKLIPIIGFVIIAVISAACGTNHSSNFATKAQCLAAYHRWARHDGVKDFRTVENAANPIVVATRNHDSGEVRRTAHLIINADNTVLHNMPPNCVPNVDSHLSAALNETNSAARADLKGNYNQAETEFKQSARNFVGVSTAIHNYLRRKK